MKWLTTACLSVVLMAGCQQNPPKRLNAPPQGDSSSRSKLQAPFAVMTDNALLADMSVADIHFAGCTTELNGTGEARMERLAELLKKYGGKLNYTTNQTDTSLVQSRLSRLEEYLEKAGVDMDKVTVQRGMPASEGMTASEAIAAQKAPTAGGGESTTVAGEGSLGGAGSAAK